MAKDDYSYSIVQRNKRRGIMTWYARVKKHGETNPHYYSLGTTKKGEATALLADKIAQNAFDLDDCERITFRTAVQKFLRKCEQNGIKDGSTATYTNALACLVPLYDMEVRTTPAEEVIDAFNDTFGELSSATYNVRKVICSSLYHYLIDELDLPIKNPFRKLRSKKVVPVKKKSFWTMEQIEAILDNARSPKHRLFYAFMAYAGLRCFEAQKIRCEDIRDGKIYVVGKGDKAAFVPICDKLQLEIDCYDGDYDFSKVALDQVFKESVRQAGVLDDARCSFHRLRHSFGSNLIRAGVNVKAVQLLMRHSNIQTTLNIYAHILDGDLFEAVNRLK